MNLKHLQSLKDLATTMILNQVDYLGQLSNLVQELDEKNLDLNLKTASYELKKLAAFMTQDASEYVEDAEEALNDIRKDNP